MSRPATFVLVIAAALVIATMPGCKRRYQQDSAQAVVESARQMVADHKAERLTDLIYADGPEMRRLLNQVGGLLGSLQDLALAVQEAYPDEVAEIRREALEAAERGEADDILSRVFTGSRGGPNRGQDPGDIINTIVLTFMIDPYAFLDEQEDRLTSVPIADDMAALQWDGKPIFGPMIGLSLRETDGKWQVVLPTHLPPVAEVLDDPDMRQLLGDLMATLENAVDDVRKDVESGEARTLEQAASHAGEHAALPAMMVFFAMGKYQEAVEDEKRAAREAESEAPEDG